jgi:hypothetical protein
MNKTASPLGVQTYSQGKITIDLEPCIYEQLQKQSVSPSEFICRLVHFIATLENNKEK